MILCCSVLTSVSLGAGEFIALAVNDDDTDDTAGFGKCEMKKVGN